MQFTSLAYPVFFAAVFAAYWALPAKTRTALCLAASLGFYACFGLTMPAVLLLCIAVSYLGGLALSAKRTRMVMIVMTALTLAPLLFYKYFNALFGAFVPEKIRAFSLMMPVGLSFFTFKAVAYLAEVYKGKLAACRRPAQYALYVSFFPEVSMGPIQRPDDLLRQIETPRSFETQKALQGAQLVLWGYFQKRVIADNLVPMAQKGMQEPQLVLGLSVLIAAALYAVQLYADFAGYSCIASGCMQLLGFDAPENFRAPYFAHSVREFWGRWHMTLSSWLRDYIYIPLGGSRCSTARCCANLLITFFISGLWHGTGLQFAVWGLLHGFYLVFGRLTQKPRSAAWRAVHIPEKSLFARTVKTAMTVVLVCIGWVFFGAKSVPDALGLFVRMAQSNVLSVTEWKNALVMLGFNEVFLARMLILTAAFFLVDFLSRKEGFGRWIAARRNFVQVILCYGMIFCILYLAPLGASPAPVYFEF